VQFGGCRVVIFRHQTGGVCKLDCRHRANVSRGSGRMVICLSALALTVKRPTTVRDSVVPSATHIFVITSRCSREVVGTVA